RAYDEGGAIASSGRLDQELLHRLDALPYYGMPCPKSLANEFGTETILPMIRESLDFSNGRLSIADAMRTYVEHIAGQVERAVAGLGVGGGRMLVTSGGADNEILVSRLKERVGAEVIVPH